ncbi:MAG: hypothetical protein LBU28_04540, partial [Spirochaetaceae bacterium]|nr:hypothetical protein [Spirochaetaceae bacterium]
IYPIIQDNVFIGAVAGVSPELTEDGKTAAEYKDLISSLRGNRIETYADAAKIAANRNYVLMQSLYRFWFYKGGYYDGSSDTAPAGFGGNTGPAVGTTVASLFQDLVNQLPVGEYVVVKIGDGGGDYANKAYERYTKGSSGITTEYWKYTATVGWTAVAP